MESRRPLLSSEDSPSPEREDGAEKPITSDVPRPPVVENEGEVAPPLSPLLPPLSSMDQISGYEDTSFEMTSVSSIPPPPSSAQTTPTNPQSNPLSFNLPNISEEEAREVLVEMVASHCCYGKRAARELIFTNITSSNAFHYQLETFTEGRKSTWEYEPYAGQGVDGPQNGPAPHPWSIPVQPDQLFMDHKKNFEVPHTASVKACQNCTGRGYNQCPHCHGVTTTPCLSCNGSGRKREVQHAHDIGPCLFCRGSGTKKCGGCQGDGSVPCQLCLTRGRLKCYIQLTVSWRTHSDEQVVEGTSLPDDLVRSAKGVLAVEDQQPRVFPVSEFPEETVNDVSASLVERHKEAWPNERILMQRHQVRVVPVARASCSWKSKNFSYFVFGQERQVHAPAYPQRLCWGCQIL